MTRSSLRQLLSSALLAALAVPCSTAIAGCGGNVEAPTPTTGDAGADAVADGATDTAITPDDAGMCSPVVETPSCGESVTYPCGLPIALAGDVPTSAECEILCDPVEKVTGMATMFFSCNVWPEETGASRQVSCATCAIGRRPADLRERDEELSCGEAVGDALAEMARIEAASVHAFRRLAMSLSELDAPPALRTRAREAARDEIRHARIVSRIAKSRGAARRRVAIDRSAPRPSTYDLALENAVEGCVKETLGVAYLAHQAEHASDPELRAMAASLYEDELEHAALSWDLVPFFDARLDDEHRAAIRAAQARALDEVTREAYALDPIVRAAFGVPSGRTVARLADALRTTLYA